MSELIKVLLTAMAPISELRGAIPLAVGAYHWPIWQSYFVAVIGNIIPVIFILWLLEPVSKFLCQHSKLMARFFKWLFERTRLKHTQKFERWGAVALISFVAIPLPITGAWTGSVAAFVFGIPYKKSLVLITSGVLIAGIIVSLITTGTISFLNFLIK
ncbi:MAG: small multi-drug export protein [Patescibacteria group bacterium]|jgi:uncharacterized membrane protein|nr:small multi-drug export protein [Patescibacteria group bacterium]